MFQFTVSAKNAANNADNVNSAKALSVIDKLLEKAATNGKWYAEWSSFSADDTKEVRRRIRVHYEGLGFNITDTYQGFRIGFIDSKEGTRARDFYDKAAAIMDSRVESLGSHIQKSIETNSNEGYHSVRFKVSTEDAEIIGFIKNKLTEAGFKVTLEDNTLTIVW